MQQLTKEQVMANKTLFQTIRGALVPKADARNEAGGKAYGLSPKHALAQLAATGCFNSTFYASADDQLEKVLKLANEVDVRFIAKTAIYSRQKAFMKDMPALLAAVLSTRDSGLLESVFGRAVDNGKMVRNFVQIMRSGAVGRKSLGTVSKRLVKGWIESRTDEQLFRASVGNSPSLADVVKMVHPKPIGEEREAFLGYLLGRKHNAELLPNVEAL